MNPPIAVNSHATAGSTSGRASRLFGQRFVKKEFQLRFSLVVFTMFFGMILLNWFVGRRVIEHMLQMGLVSNAEFAAHLQFVNEIVVKSSILGAVIIYGVCILYSHMIAGPIYRFEKVLEEVEKGNLDVSFRLRRFDEFPELAEKFNSALQSLREARSLTERDLEIMSALLAKLPALEKKGFKKEVQEIAALCQRLRSR